MRKMIVTSLDGRRITAEEDEGRITGLFLEKPGEESLVGRIYIGRVKQIKKNIRAAFVEIGRGIMCYYPLEEWETHPIEGVRLTEGAELPVQVEKDALKTKAPTVTTGFTFTGQYLVLTVGKRGIFFSSKIRDEEKRRALKELLSGDFPFSLIVRTNGAFASPEALLREQEQLAAEAGKILDIWKNRTAGSLLYEPAPAFLSEIFGNRLTSLDEIVTDGKEEYELIRKQLSDTALEDPSLPLPVLRLYEDPYPLSKLYSLETVLSRATKEQVWLKSGGFLVIQPTEALVAVDVNTGKSDSRKKKEETVFETNLEAAKELAVQLRLRNLSGIVIVDFIDMREDAHKEALLKVLKQELLKDPVKTTVLGFTRLNLVELTRKKVRKPLHELL